MTRIVAIILLFISAQNSFGQSEPFSKLVLKSRKGRTICSVKEGQIIKIQTLNEENFTKVKGRIIILSQNTIQIDSITIGIDSIYRIAKITRFRQISGHALAFTGGGMLAGGIVLLHESFKEEDALNSFLKLLAGTWLTGTGAGFVYVGEKMALGNYKMVAFNRKMLVL